MVGCPSGMGRGGRGGEGRVGAALLRPGFLSKASPGASAACASARGVQIHHQPLLARNCKLVQGFHCNRHQSRGAEAERCSVLMLNFSQQGAPSMASFRWKRLLVDVHAILHSLRKMTNCSACQAACTFAFVQSHLAIVNCKLQKCHQGGRICTCMDVKSTSLRT